MKNVPNDIEMAAHNAWERGEDALAFSLFMQGALMGLDGCMLDLGYFYDEGIGTECDKSRAMYWYKRAYKNKGACITSAATNIAILYKEQGKNKLSFQWFFRAAKLDDGDAQIDLAKLYLAGKGVRRSTNMAKECLLSAISSKYITEAGLEEATQLLQNIESLP